jgi:hypothetical protein
VAFRPILSTASFWNRPTYVVPVVGKTGIALGENSVLTLEPATSPGECPFPQGEAKGLGLHREGFDFQTVIVDDSADVMAATSWRATASSRALPAPDRSQVRDPFHLGRFVTVQASSYETALGKIRRGVKRSHWMWYIFSPDRGIWLECPGPRYATRSPEEARSVTTAFV